MKITKIFLVLLFITISLKSYAQNDGAGNTGLAFLKLGAGARSIAMGEAFSSISDDATAVIYNPARLNFGQNNNVTIMHSSSVQDLSTEFIAAKFKVKRFAFGFGLMKTSIDGIEVRERPGAPLDKFTAQNLSAGMSVSYMINDNLSIGATSKFLYEKIYIDDASGLAFDFGTCYSKDNLSFSFVVANLGSMNELRTQSTKLPSSARFGGGYNFKKDNFTFLVSLDGYKIFDGGSFHIHTGGEIGYKDFVFFRLGYQSNYENRNLTTGIGFKYKSMLLDYAFVPYTNDFGTSNNFSLGFTF